MPKMNEFVEPKEDVDMRKRSLEEVEARLIKVRSVLNLFSQDGWPLLMEYYEAGRQRAYSQIVEDSPIDDEMLKTLRSELVILERILHMEQVWRNEEQNLLTEFESLRLQGGTTEG